MILIMTQCSVKVQDVLIHWPRLLLSLRLNCMINRWLKYVT